MPRLTATRSLNLTPLDGAFGVEVRDIDLAAADADTAARLDTALLRNKLLIVRDQQLTERALDDLGALFERITFGHRGGQRPIAAPRSGDRTDGTDPGQGDAGQGDLWQADGSYLATPPAVSMLHVLGTDGDDETTSWSDLQAAYDALSVPMRALAGRVRASHISDRDPGERFSHPVVRVHPVTGRRGLFVNPRFTSRIDGVSDVESQGLLEILFGQLGDPANIVRHRWAAGDLAIWDGRATAYRSDRAGSGLALGRRLTVTGERPIGAL